MPSSYQNSRQKASSSTPLTSAAYFEEVHNPCNHEPTRRVGSRKKDARKRAINGLSKVSRNRAIRTMLPIHSWSDVWVDIVRKRREAKKRRDYRLECHAGLLKIKRFMTTDETTKVGGLRGNVKGFSRASRKRMIELLASIRQAGSMLFVTFTYPDNFPLDDAIWHRHFEALRDRFEHRYPMWRAIWRLELVERKSGVNQGFIAPHWHWIIFMPPVPEPMMDEAALLARIDLSLMWYEVVASEDPKHAIHGVWVAPVRNIRHAMSYLSKYVAKIGSDTLEIGRRWGRIGKFDTSSSQTVLLTFDEYVNFKRIVRNWMRKRGGKYHKRFARLCAAKGATIFGLGDESEYNWLLFVYEAMRQKAQT